MAVPDFQTLMLPVLETVPETEISVGDLVEAISNKVNLSDEDRIERIPSGKISRISSRVQWAGTYLVKAGLLERPRRGYLKITTQGKDTLKEKPPRIDINFLNRFESFKVFREASGSANENEENKSADENKKTPEDLIGESYSLIEKTAREEILDMILNSSPQFFERVLLDLFQAMGYGGRGKATHVGKSGDGGIDGIIDEDPLGLEKIYLQAKRYAVENKISIDQIRSFAGSLDEQGATKGIFVTTSSFVSNAYEYAKRSPKSLILIDGNELTSLMYEYDVGVRTVQTIKIKKPDIDYFEDL
jgi:restriction system protein